ncbi:MULTISPECIES: prolyl aminopeptidase [Thiohalobacter]|uniref:Proline iminopeptidase n=1 Tax=Thiohalobacter thiocyanaticus TaxID=585455 RepID=A0A1Z4VMA4_9GAMM|nr:MULTISPECIES: prolyl aminopeptidase [Thiohalobacter]BAZ92741.1 proline iminopeptidase [Thiohalobacter thiocyanaticus]
MAGLYPDIKPYVQHTLDVDPPHVLHVEECGNPTGLPVVFLHGGPGGGCEPYHRRFFDPERYRIVLFDQRGCGRSAPHAELEGNTTHTLVADLERIRAHLGIERWVVFGGSWGSTLGLVYAQTHPERVLAMILRGIFLCRPRDIAWFYQDGAGRLFPEAWEEYLELIPPAERSDMVRAYHARLTSDDEVHRMQAAKAWALWEARASTLLPREAVIEHFGAPYTALSLARIEAHYFVNDCFLEPDQILDRADRLRDIPGVIVHGRYDCVCPVEQAVALHRVWPQADLQIVPDAGHAASEPGIIEALVGATDSFADKLGAF